MSALPVALRLWRIAVAVLVATWLSWTPAQAQETLRPVPPLTERVIDQTGTLNETQRRQVIDRLAQVESGLGSQMVVLMVPTTRPEDIAAFAFRVADQWKIGRRDVGDGVLIVVAKNERTVRIEVAKALEGAIPDLAARQVIDRAMVPAFKANDFTGGLLAAIDLLETRIKGEGLPPPEVESPARPGTQWEDLGIFFFVGVPIVGAVLGAILGRKLGSMATGAAAGALGWWWTGSVVMALGALLVGMMLSGAMGGGRRGRSVWYPGGLGGGGWGGRSGGFGGGGFSSGGGGNFGGGGASGNW